MRRSEPNAARGRTNEPGPRSERLAACAAALGLALLSSCAEHAATGSPAPAASEVVARVGATTLTVSELEARLREKPPFSRARYAERDKKEAFVEEQIRAEVLAAEAARRGFGDDPDVVRATRRLMVTKLFERDFEAKWRPGEVPDAAVAEYYAQHAGEFKQPEQVRIIEIVVHDAATAERLEKELHERALPPGDTKTFASLVARYSEDEASRARGGEVPFFDRNSTALPAPVVAAAFELRDVGEVSPPVQSDGNFVILMLAQRRQGFERTIAEVAPDIRQRLLAERRQKARDAFVEDLVKKSSIERHPENLDRIVVAGPPLAASAPRK